MLLTIFAEDGHTIVQLSSTYLGKRGSSARNKVPLQRTGVKFGDILLQKSPAPNKKKAPTEPESPMH